jgi:hypothetical protein
MIHTWVAAAPPRCLQENPGGLQDLAFYASKAFITRLAVPGAHSAGDLAYTVAAEYCFRRYTYCGRGGERCPDLLNGIVFRT